MTIDEAKKAIKETITMYLEKDIEGKFIIPINKQKPIAIMGATGIGKTEIILQIAKELDIGFVSYSITHHTRQSLLGLPMITSEEYEGKTISVTHYTLSEILLEVYRMQESGISQGVLFLDEFNTASETLAGAMLLLLLDKKLGQNQLPEGWVIVLAGNPSEYNKSVKSFDAATKDRLRVFNVSPDLAEWMNYACSKEVNPLVQSYLKQYPHHFYIFEKNKNDMELVTPRSWEDLSITLNSYNRLNFMLTADVVAGVIQSQKVVASFMNFYHLYRSLTTKGELDEILCGENIARNAEKFSGLDFNSRWALVSALMNQTNVFASKLESYNEGDRKAFYKEINHIITNCLSFLMQAYGYSPELEIYMNQLISNKSLALTLLHCENALYKKLCEELLFHDSNQKLLRDIKKVV